MWRMRAGVLVLGTATIVDRAIARAKAPLALNAPAQIEHSPTEIKGPMSRYRRY
jgi:hypothetical protein